MSKEQAEATVTAKLKELGLSNGVRVSSRTIGFDGSAVFVELQGLERYGLAPHDHYYQEILATAEANGFFM